MVETDWREILSFAQKELAQDDKEKLCESLSWMEADDIELNFTDLKTLFRLAQDILKYKSEQVNNLLGQLETSHRKGGKPKVKSPYKASPTRSNDSGLDTIANQEEVIKANKHILKQLYVDIAELEERKSKLEEDRSNFDRDSESSRDPLSELDAVAQLENEITLKNRHIRKLLSDIKVLEEDNTNLKEKLSQIKDKLSEATNLIENLTEQLISLNEEISKLKNVLGKSEKEKAKISIEIESLRKQLFEKEYNRKNFYEEIKSKAQHWKNLAKAKKAELEALSLQNMQLKEDLVRNHGSTRQPSTSPTVLRREQQTMRELQDKLSEASMEMIQSAKLIDTLKEQIRQLRVIVEENNESDAHKNESDDGKERSMIVKLKKKIQHLTVSLNEAEDTIVTREEELTEKASQLQLLQSEEGIKTLLEEIKNKKRQLDIKEDAVKSLVKEINDLNETVNDLQLQNEILREKLNLPRTAHIPTKGILKKYYELEKRNTLLGKAFRKTENKIVALEIDNRNVKSCVTKLIHHLECIGYTREKVEEIYQSSDSDGGGMPIDGGGDSRVAAKTLRIEKFKEINTKREDKLKAIVEENESLRKGLQEILEFLKDNSTTSSGILALQCPSLEAVVTSLNARHSAGWFAPHMTAVMELKAAIGGRDALLLALHDAKKETFNVMKELSKESQKANELQQKLSEMQSNTNETEEEPIETNVIGKFGTWMSENDQNNLNFYEKSAIENIFANKNSLYEVHLKNTLAYFHDKFKTLYNTLTSISVQATDDQNKWYIQEEEYKAQIENLKIQLNEVQLGDNDDDTSELSPGLVTKPSICGLQKRCSYLEESYKYIRTLNENLKNDYITIKKEAMTTSADNEAQIQALILSVTNLIHKLRSSIPFDLFWKQNIELNELHIKYRKLLEDSANKQNNYTDLIERLEADKRYVLSTIQKDLINSKDKAFGGEIEQMLSSIEQSVLQKQLHELCVELEVKNKRTVELEKINTTLQETQARLIDTTLATETKEEINWLKEQIVRLTSENDILKEQCQHTSGQLDIALLQIQDSQQRQLANDIEVNMLRHQILDLQSTGDNKAIIARLSGEVLIAHLHGTENQKKIDSLHLALNREKNLRIETEEMMNARQKIFDVYSNRYESKFRYIFEIMHTLRHQYQGCLPTTSIENYINNIEDMFRKTLVLDEKLNEVEDLQSSLISKHSIYDQILDIGNAKCFEDEDSCPHKLSNIVAQGLHSRELECLKKKVQVLEQSKDGLLRQCSYLDKSLVLLNQGFGRTVDDLFVEKPKLAAPMQNLELEDIDSDAETDSATSRTITLTNPLVLNQPKQHNDMDMTAILKNDVPNTRVSENLQNNSVTESFTIPQDEKRQNVPKLVNAFIQTSIDLQKTSKIVQTEGEEEIIYLKKELNDLQNKNTIRSRESDDLKSLLQQCTDQTNKLKSENIKLETNIQFLKEQVKNKDAMTGKLHATLEDLTKQIDDLRKQYMIEINRRHTTDNEEIQRLISYAKQLEDDKNVIVSEYKKLITKEREEFSRNIKEKNLKIVELQTKIDRKETEFNSTNADATREAVRKYTVKITQLEDQCFKLEHELDEYKNEISSYQKELQRWKDLANERLSRMEQLDSQLQERHSDEVDSYKAENQHWLLQLSESQRENLDLRSKLTEQKTLYIKQLSDKDTQIEQLRSVINNLKTQVMSMQTVMSVNDPNFDLSAIVEEEASDASQRECAALELKFHSVTDLHDHDDSIRVSASSTSIWQDSIIERLRREKQLVGKQNAILRRQIKALAGRERRARIDAQNLKNQVFRISTSGSRGGTAEAVALQNKIASLQAQLLSARRDTHSSISLWDKWKRSQQGAERWQARYEEKCSEVKKLDANLNMARSAMSRLEREKRLLLNKLGGVKNYQQLSIIEEKQDAETSEKMFHSNRECDCGAIPVSSQALLERIEAQQRRIVALEYCEKGHEFLVSEYEKSLAEITSLKGQVLKLESTLLEAQIKSPSPLKSASDAHNDLEYWKSYCEMLKEENVQLTYKVNSLEHSPGSAHGRVSDLEQTVLTLRGLVSKLQSEQKSNVVQKRVDSRAPDKGRNPLESYRVEIANLKRSIQDKDSLLERSKEMLKMAADREDELLRENSILHRTLNDEMNQPKDGFLSV